MWDAKSLRKHSVTHFQPCFSYRKLTFLRVVVSVCDRESDRSSQLAKMRDNVSRGLAQGSALST